MVAHNKNYKPSSQAPTPSHKPPPAKPRYAEPKDEVSPLCETDLICELADPSNSLEDLCAAMQISLEALSLWMARPDVAERLDLVQTTAMNRARFIGRLTLPVAAQSAANIINAHKLRPQKPTIDSAFNTELHRANENMLKAARFLERLTAEPAPRRARNSKVPPQAEASPDASGKPNEAKINTPPGARVTGETKPASQNGADLKTDHAQSHAPLPIEDADQNTQTPPRRSRAAKNRSFRNSQARARKSRAVPHVPNRSRINQSRTSTALVSATAAPPQSIAPRHPKRAANPATPIPRTDTAPPRTRARAHAPPLRASSD